MPASEANEAIIARPQRMMSRMVTTSSAEPRSMTARATNRRSSQRTAVNGRVWPIGISPCPPRRGSLVLGSISIAGGGGELRRECWQSLPGVRESTVGHGVGEPVAFALDVGHFGFAGHGCQADEVDHRLGPVGVGQLVVGAAAQRVVRAGIDADAA